MTRSGFRLDIQGIRGFALVLVLGAHAGLPFMEGGFVGLDIFYVLSGFLITGLILEEVKRTGRVSLLRFYARRARRLLPLAATVLGVIFLGSLLFFSAVRSHEVAGDITAAALYFVNWRFIAEQVDYFQFDDPSVSPVQHYWSLSVEEQFYLVWPVLVLGLLWFAARSGRRPKTLIATAIGVLGLASLVYGIVYSPLDPQAAYFSTLTRVWQIALGCGLAVLLPLAIRLPRAVSALLTAGALVALVWTTASFSAETPYPGWQALFPTLATGAIIIAGTATVASGPIRLLCVAPLQYLGKISYAWYLWHWPALAFAAAAIGELTVPQKVAVTLLAWFPTIASHHLIEERFRRSRSLARRPRRAMALGLACTGGAAVLGISLAALQTSVPEAAGEVRGARAAPERREEIQREVRAIRPDPRRAKRDREPPKLDGCHLKNNPITDPPECVYGDRASRTTLVNVGDSHALMYSPALIEVAQERGLRLVNVTRDTCTLADVEFKPDCDEWRENAVGLIERERPDVVIVHTGTDDDERYAVVRDGERLSRDASERALEEGFVRTLRRLRDTGAKVVVIRDVSKAPEDVVECVGENAKELERCAFAPDRSEARAFDARAARAVRGVELVDPMPVLCPDGRCPAVIGDALVYRNATHFTATFAETLAPWLERRLRAIGAI